MNKFGGDWTEEKLVVIRKYCQAYSTILSKKYFQFAYIDAFAGTGYRESKKKKENEILLFPEFLENEQKALKEGSARIVLNIKPEFNKYIFIEKNPKNTIILESIKKEYPNLQDKIIIQTEEANKYLSNLCLNKNWSKHRALVFLDPFGMQVEWTTIEAIAQTKAIDLWYLFPTGIGVNRLLKKDGKINDSNQKRLDKIFGTKEWRKAG